MFSVAPISRERSTNEVILKWYEHVIPVKITVLRFDTL